MLSRTPRIRLAAPGRVYEVLVALVLLAATTPCGAQGFATVHSFSSEYGGPVSNLIEVPDGRLFGTAPSGGPYGLGVIYILTPDGSGGYSYSNLRVFQADSPGGYWPESALIRATDGLLYGTTASPVQCGGSIFRISPEGDFTDLYDFSCSSGSFATARLLQASDGNFYGVTTRQGPAGFGTLFRMDSDGNFEVLHAFTAAEGFPVSSLLEGSDGFLYGTAENSVGVVYRAGLDGALSILHTFGNGEGSGPSGDLLQAGDGWIYGVTASGGGNARKGTIFRVQPDGTFEQRYTFPQTGPRSPRGGLIEVSGTLYGTTAEGGNGGGVVFTLSPAGVLTVLHALEGTEGYGPAAALLLTSSGSLVGACSAGGGPGGGTVFEIDTSLQLSVLHAFGALDGNYPQGDLTLGSDGNLYGLTTNAGPWGMSTLFRLDPTESFSVVHAFTREEGTGAYTNRLLSLGPTDFYGFTIGGLNPEGTFYRSDLSGVLTPLHEFVSEGGIPAEVHQASDGYLYGANNSFILRLDGVGGISFPHAFSDSPSPNSALTQISDGFLYGTTRLGGAGGAGTIYRMSLDGAFEEVYAFSGPDGSNPERQMRLVEGPDGALYGTTSEGGAFGFGTVFRFQPPSALTTLHSFNSDDGGLPMGSVVPLADGRVCGVTFYGGAGGGGRAFCLSPDGSMSILHDFDPFHNPSDGWEIFAGLMLAPDGGLYGMTSHGGIYGGGTIFRAEIPDYVSIGGVSPAGGSAEGGTPFAVMGFHFQYGAAVTIGDASAMNVVVADDTHITATSPALPAGTVNDLWVTNLDGGRAVARKAWFVDFLDVPGGNLFHDAIARAVRDGITVGCGAGNFCPEAAVTRAQMAVLLLKARLGPGYVPPPPLGTLFTDVPVDAFAAAWIEDLVTRGITAGCGGGRYCPDAPITRAQMAVFLLKGLLGTDYVPPPATGGVFEDVPVDQFAAAWIEDLGARAITAGCSTMPPLFCPAGAVARGQMAALLVNAFGLP